MFRVEVNHEAQHVWIYDTKRDPTVRIDFADLPAAIKALVGTFAAIDNAACSKLFKTGRIPAGFLEDAGS